MGLWKGAAHLVALGGGSLTSTAVEGWTSRPTCEARSISKRTREVKDWRGRGNSLRHNRPFPFPGTTSLAAGAAWKSTWLSTGAPLDFSRLGPGAPPSRQFTSTLSTLTLSLSHSH